MSKAGLNSLSVRPVIHFPKEAEAGRTYLLTIDLAPQQALDTWPYPDDEEVTIYCLPNAEPLFSCEPLGEPAVVIHRFGGTYGPARFLITAAAAPQEGVIRVTLVNGLGVPMTAFETSPIRLLEKVERKQEADIRVRREPAAAERPREVVTPPAEPVEPIVPVEPDEPEHIRRVQRVYLSSTYTDLREYREAVYRALRAMRVDVLAMEDYVTSYARPLEKVLNDVAECDVYLGIIAWRYGFVPAEDNPEGLSITELEYRHARSLGKPCLIYLLHEEARWPPGQFEQDERAEKVRRLRDELSRNHLVTLFRSTDELAARVSADITRFKYRPEVEKESVESPALPPEAISISRLPVTGSQLFGREEELRRLDVEWINRDAHILTLVGWGGIGKSALVNHWLARMARDNYRGSERVYGWSFRDQGTTDRTASADQFIESALRFFGDSNPIAGTPWEKGERLALLVGRRRALLILDGLEALQHPPGPDEGSLREPSMQALLRGLAAYNQGLCVITTRVRVADLTDFENSTVNRLALESLSPEAGAQVLTAHGARGTEAELEQASREYDGHPLSLSLLGSYLNDVFGGDIGRRGEVRGLEEDERYGRTARELLTSYERWLGEGPETAVLRVLSLSTGGMDQTAFDAVRAAPAIQGLTEALQSLNERRWQQVLSRLRRAGLLAAQPATQPGLLKTHPLVRDHFSSQLADFRPQAWREGNNRLYEHYKRVTKEFPDTLEEMLPLYAAVNYGCAAGRHQEALDKIYHRRILRGDRLYNQRVLGAFSHDLAVLSNFFRHPWSQVIDGLVGSSDRFVLTMAAHDLSALGRLRESTQAAEVSLNLATSRGQWIDAALSANNLCETYLLVGDLSRALAIARQGMDFADRSGSASEQFVMRATLANVLHQTGSFAEAEQAFIEAEKIQRNIPPSSRLYTVGEFHYCDLLLDMGRYQEAIARAEEIRVREVQPEWTLGIALNYLTRGRAVLLRGTQGSSEYYSEAISYLRQAVDGLRRVDAPQYLSTVLLACGEFYRIEGAFDRAMAEIDEAMAVATRGALALHQADCLLGYARLYLSRGETEQARESWSRAYEMIERLGYHRRDQDVQEIERQLSEGPSKLLATRRQVLIAYSHRDRKWFDRLDVMLRPLTRRNVITSYDDVMITETRGGRADFLEAIKRARVLVLLVTADLLASEFVADLELRSLLERGVQEGLRLIWIAVKPSAYQHTFLLNYQAANDPTRPLSSLRNMQREEMLIRVCREIERALGPSEGLGSADAVDTAAVPKTELKVVMFTDQVSPTRNMARRTPTEIKQVAREQDDLTAEVVKRCRGTILKDTGDGHLIEFPTCIDAVRCGYLLQRRVAERNGSQPSARLRFDLHVGIDFGEAVILPNGDLRANTANLAARVSSICPAGEVYFTEKVMQELNPSKVHAERVEVAEGILKRVEGTVNLYRLVEWLDPVETALNIGASNDVPDIQSGDALRRDPYRLVGTTIAGKYQLVTFTGSGGLAAVYRSFQPEEKRWVAVKILKPDILIRNSEYAEFFVREAEIGRRLVHPHIVTFIESGIEDENIPFIVIEWLDGETLEELLSRSPVLPMERIINIVAQTCDALTYAHTNNILHLDVKPANIFLLKGAESSDNIKLIDFGLGRILIDNEDSFVTKFAGTPQYCAPETLGGRFTHRSDIYSLGATLYYMLTGVVPFGTSYINAKLHPNLELPTLPSLLTVRPDLPEDVDIVIRKALSKNPDQRQESVKQFFDEFVRACGSDV
jgi:class 3 adenylate cyclase/tetratricopeptide (TPR) repeat protein